MQKRVHESLMPPGGLDAVSRKIVRSAAVWQAIAVSDSMVPLIERGSILRIEKGSPKSLRTNDIAAFLSPNGTVIVHRIISLSKTRYGNLTFIMRGDNAEPQKKQTVPEKTILGRVTAVSYPGKTISLDNPVHIVFRYLPDIWRLKRLVRRLAYGKLYR